MSILKVRNELEELNSKLLLPTCYILNEHKAGKHTILQRLSLTFHILSIYTFESSHLQNSNKKIWSHSTQYVSKKYG